MNKRKMYILSIIFFLILIYFIFTFILFSSQRNLLYLPVENNYQGDELTVDIQKVKVITNDNFELLAWYHKKDISNGLKLITFFFVKKS